MESNTQQTRDTIPTQIPARNPLWWKDQHNAAWDRVRDAFQRDWEQTKVDLAGLGPDLNQSVGNTVKQALGKEVLPPVGVRNPTDPKDVAKAIVKDAERHLEAVKHVEKVREEMETERARTAAVIETAQANVTGEYVAMAKAAAKRDAAVSRWHIAEREARYGYSARSQYPAGQTWDDSVDGKLGSEWEVLGVGTTWEVSRAGVRRGWDYALVPGYALV